MAECRTRLRPRRAPAWRAPNAEWSQREAVPRHGKHDGKKRDVLSGGLHAAVMRCRCWSIFGAVVAFAATQNVVGGVADSYLNAYLEMFPTRATQAGNHAFDGKLEDFSAERLQRWVDFNQSER